MKKIISGVCLSLAFLGSNVNLGASETSSETKVLQNYSETVPSYDDNATTADYFRADKNANWQVSLDTSYETSNSNTKTRFWLEAGYDNVSKGYDVLEGSGVHSYGVKYPYSGYVHLAMEDNDDGGASQYKVFGRWDEE